MSRHLVLDMTVVQDDAEGLKMIGFISNHEFCFFTEEDRKRWFFETSLDVYKSMDVLQEGDPELYHMHGEFEGGIPDKPEVEKIDTSVANYIIVQIAKHLCDSDFSV